jgi:hypothetical protein
MPVHDWTRVTPGIFHGFHHRWISSISDFLNEKLLPPSFYALPEQIAGGLGPDVLTLESKFPSNGNHSGNGLASPGIAKQAGVALATSPPKVRFTAAAEPDMYAAKAKAIAIRHASDDRVVAVLEIVSPGNKSNRHGVRTFVEKAVEFLKAGIHLLIVDLFPPTPRDPRGLPAAVWTEIMDHQFSAPDDKPLTAGAFSAGLVKRVFLEPFGAADPLPEMPLFLEPEQYVPLPLEITYQSAFEHVPQRWRAELEHRA